MQTASSEVQTTFDNRLTRELPLNGRNPLELVVLTPGADFTDEGIVGNVQSNGTVDNQQDNFGIVVNGLRPVDNNFKVDGANFNNVQFGSAPTLPNPDSLEEFTVQSSNFNALESRAGAVVQMSTRSGTNALHGSAFEFLRNDVSGRPQFLRRSSACLSAGTSLAAPSAAPSSRTGCFTLAPTRAPSRWAAPIRNH